VILAVYFDDHLNFRYQMLPGPPKKWVVNYLKIRDVCLFVPSFHVRQFIATTVDRVS
jgi:hypothetical protein